MKISLLEKKDITDELAEKLNKTWVKYFGLSYWNVDIIHDVYQEYLYHRKTPSVYIIEDAEDTILIFVFKDILGTNKYGFDYCKRLMFYDNNLWLKCPCAMKFFSTMNMSFESKTLLIPYVDNKGENLRDFIKSIKNNFIPHFFGEKSKQYSLSYFFEDYKLVLEFVLKGLQRMGWERYSYLKEKGEFVFEKMHDWIFDIKDFRDKISITVVWDRDKNFAGFLTWYIVNNILYLDEILIDKSSHLLPLSLYNVVTLHTIHNAFSNHACKKAYLGVNFNSLGNYKDSFISGNEELQFISAQFLTVEDAKKVLL